MQTNLKHQKTDLWLLGTKRKERLNRLSKGHKEAFGVVDIFAT